MSIFEFRLLTQESHFASHLVLFGYYSICKELGWISPLLKKIYAFHDCQVIRTPLILPYPPICESRCMILNKNCIDVKDQKHYSLEFDSTISDLRMIFLKFHCDNISAPLLPFHRKGFTFENITSLLQRRKYFFLLKNVFLYSRV